MQNLYIAPDQPVGLSKFLHHHKAKIIIVWLAGMALTLAYLSLVSRKYQSEAKLLVRPGRETVALDPTAKSGQFISSAESRETQVYAVEELLSSRALAEKVIDRFGVDTILGRDPTKTGGISLSRMLSWLDAYNLNPLRVYSTRDVALGAFRKNLGVAIANKSNVVNVSYVAKDPKHAHQVLEALLEVAREEYVQAHRVHGSQEFFVEQTAILKEKLTKLEEQLRDMKSATGLSALATQRELQLKLIDSLEADLYRARAERDAADAEVAHRQDALSRTPAFVVTARASGLPQTASQTLREKLYDLEVKEEEFAAKLTDVHPQMIVLRDQLNQARDIADRENVPEQVTHGLSTTHQAAELAVQERQASLSSLGGRTQSLEKAILAAREKLKQLNNSELVVLRLERDIELVRTNYFKYAESLEEARINHALEEAKISSLNVMQSPTLSETPVRPQPLRTLAMGFVLSGLAGVGTAVCAQHRAGRRAAPPVVVANGDDVATLSALGSELARRREAALANSADPPSNAGNGLS